MSAPEFEAVDRRKRMNAYSDAYEQANGCTPVIVWERGYYRVNGVRRTRKEVDDMTAVLRKRVANQALYPALAARLGEGWAVDAKNGGVRKGMVRVWQFHDTTGRYGAEFNNCVVSTKADARTPENAVAKVLSGARRYAELTLEDIGKVEAK